MLIVISPAKKLDFKTKSNTSLYSTTNLMEHSQILIDELRKCTIADLTKLMNISYGLSEQNIERHLNWDIAHNKEQSKQAILAFNGQVFSSIDAKTFTEKDFEVAQNSIRIISGLYGLLRPLDLIMPHRLSMGTKLPTVRGKNLYEFWGDIVVDELNVALSETKNNILINLASKEYFKAIKTEKVNGKVVNIVFKENKNGIYRVVRFHAKKARGLMSNFVIRNEISTIEELKSFNLAGYGYDEAQSDESKIVFVR